MRYFFYFLFFAFFSCGRNNNNVDASGTFEADEVIVSAEAGGTIDSLAIDEGSNLLAGQVVGFIDAENIRLQKEQVEASVEALKDKTSNVQPQISLLQEQLSVQQAQLNNLLHERNRIQNLLREDAATGKQLDDINNQVEVVRRQMEVTQHQMDVQRSNTSTQNRGILSEGLPLQKKIEQLDKQISDTRITNPVKGTVIAKYAESGEMTAIGKALYKVADLSEMTLRAYVSGNQFSRLKLGQQVQVLVDNGTPKQGTYPGIITWISDKAEFTPKTIQTKEERTNLVYAIKIKVKNDGLIKIGMYGDVKFNQPTTK